MTLKQLTPIIQPMSLPFKDGEIITFSLDVQDKAIKQMGGTLYTYTRKPVKCKIVGLFLTEKDLCGLSSLSK